MSHRLTFPYNFLPKRNAIFGLNKSNINGTYHNIRVISSKRKTEKRRRRRNHAENIGVSSLVVSLIILLGVLSYTCERLIQNGSTAANVTVHEQEQDPTPCGRKANRSRDKPLPVPRNVPTAPRLPPNYIDNHNFDDAMEAPAPRVTHNTEPSAPPLPPDYHNNGFEPRPPLYQRYVWLMISGHLFPASSNFLLALAFGLIR